jgi:hypothetical protein
VRLALVGDPALLALHGADGRFAWGELRALRAGDDDALAAFGPDVVISLGDEPAHGGSGEPADGGSGGPAQRGSPAVATWREEPSDAADGVRTIAPGGEGLWRRAPLPAADALFSVGGQPGRGVLVVGGDDEAREAAVLRLAGQRVEARASGRPAPAELASAAVVAVLGPAEGPMPAIAFAALACSRLVLAPRAAPAFGLAAGVDHLAHGHHDELAQLAEAATAWPAAFAPVAAMGRLAAEACRASAVYGRVAADLAAS